MLTRQLKKERKIKCSLLNGAHSTRTITANTHCTHTAHSPTHTHTPSSCNYLYGCAGVHGDSPDSPLETQEPQAERHREKIETELGLKRLLFPKNNLILIFCVLKNIPQH